MRSAVSLARPFLAFAIGVTGAASGCSPYSGTKASSRQRLFPKKVHFFLLRLQRTLIGKNAGG